VENKCQRILDVKVSTRIGNSRYSGFQRIKYFDEFRERCKYSYLMYNY